MIHILLFCLAFVLLALRFEFTGFAPRHHDHLLAAHPPRYKPS